MSRPPQDAVDLVIVGAGVVGCAIAARVAGPTRRVLLLDREVGEGRGLTSRNSGVIHSGIHYPPGSHKAVLCVRGQELLYRWSEDRDVPTSRLGKIVVAHDDEQAEQLESILERGRAAGARDLRLLTSREVRALEPSLPPARAALLAPWSGIVDAHALAHSLALACQERGGDVAFRAEVLGIHKDSDYRVETTRGEIRAERVVNAAGLEADRIGEMCGLTGHRHHLCRGDYFRVGGDHPWRHLVYPVPVPGRAGLGIHLTLELDGSARLGPDAEWVEDAQDLGPREHKLEAFLAAARKLLGPIDPSRCRWDGCGIRPRLGGKGTGAHDFVFAEGSPGSLHLLGIESPGLTSALAIAEVVETWVRSGSLPSGVRAG